LPGASSPIGFAKCVLASFSSRARLFIIRTNAARVPATCSASVTAASLADSSISPRTRSATDSRSPGRRLSFDSIGAAT
jgi:hypothetical protein